MSMQELINVLREIESHHEISESEVLNDCVIEDMHPLIHKATLLAQQVLLMDLEEGGRNYYAEDLLTEDSGYVVSTIQLGDNPWLMGGIETAKGVIVYA